MLILQWMGSKKKAADGRHKCLRRSSKKGSLDSTRLFRQRSLLPLASGIGPAIAPRIAPFRDHDAEAFLQPLGHQEAGRGGGARVPWGSGSGTGRGRNGPSFISPRRRTASPDSDTASFHGNDWRGLDPRRSGLPMDPEDEELRKK